VAAATLQLDRVLGLEVDPWGDDLVADERLAMAVAADARLGGQGGGNAGKDQCGGGKRFEHGNLLVGRNQRPIA